MNIICLIFINAIIVFTPILVYFLFVAYSQNMKKEKSEILLSIILFLTLYLAMTFKEFIPIHYQITCIALPVYCCYLFKRDNEAIIFYIIISEYLIRELNYSFYVLIISICVFHFLYRHFIKTSKDDGFLLKCFFAIIILNLVLNEAGIIMNSKECLLDVVVASVLLFVNLYVLNVGFREAKVTLSLHMSLKEFEKEKNIKINLFKITHEIKNPIAVVSGYIDMFDPSDVAKSKRYIGIIKNEIDRTLNLLSDFMEFSKIKLEKKEVDLNLLIDDVKDVLIPFFRAKNVNYYFEVEEDCTLSIDYLRMKQVVLNVIKNAVEACSPNVGQVSTTVFRDSDYAYIYVKDNGCGMSKEIIDNMLVPFYTTKEKGTGLGVSLSKEIIEAHNGSISYSSSIGKGTVCKIILPLKD